MKLQFKTIQGKLCWVLTELNHVELVSRDQAERFIQYRRALLCRLN
ncbi:MAG: hypothetical protein CENE_00005 [Candidatus Celerinatantimonas neptuna]|nr:MAG: hypothetical protein CENE_00005 [Candidatus Celerinatantimonas neptuna]